MTEWRKGKFWIADFSGLIHQVDGHLYGDLGLNGSGGLWHITHLNAGFQLVPVQGGMAHARRIIEDLAALDIWDVSHPEGFANREPEWSFKVGTVLGRHGINVSHGGGPPTFSADQLAVARRVLERRLEEGY